MFKTNSEKGEKKKKKNETHLNYDGKVQDHQTPLPTSFSGKETLALRPSYGK